MSEESVSGNHAEESWRDGREDDQWLLSLTDDFVPGSRVTMGKGGQEFAFEVAEDLLGVGARGVDLSTHGDRSFAVTSVDPVQAANEVAPGDELDRDLAAGGISKAQPIEVAGVFSFFQRVESDHIDLFPTSA